MGKENATDKIIRLAKERINRKKIEVQELKLF